MIRAHTEDGITKRRQEGRPRLPDGAKRDRPVKVYFDRANYAKLGIAAEEQGARSPKSFMNWL